MYTGVLQFSSVTHAFEAKKVLERSGITTLMQRLPINLGCEGCGYVLKIKQKELDNALSILNQNHIKVKRVFNMQQEE